MYGLTYRLSSLSNTTSANIPKLSPAPIPCPCIAAITGTLHLIPTSNIFVSVNFASPASIANNVSFVPPQAKYVSYPVTTTTLQSPLLAICPNTPSSPSTSASDNMLFSSRSSSRTSTIPSPCATAPTTFVSNNLSPAFPLHSSLPSPPSSPLHPNSSCLPILSSTTLLVSCFHSLTTARGSLAHCPAISLPRSSTCSASATTSPTTRL